MKVTKETRTRDIEPLLTIRNVEQVLKAVPSVPLKRSVVSMTIADFEEVSRGTIPMEITRERKAWRYLGKLRKLKEEMEQVERFCKRVMPKQTAEDRAAAVGVEFPTGVERMLLDVATFFSLHSFEEAERVSVASWMLIAKDKSAAVKFERNRNRLAAEKQRKGARK